MTMPYLVSFHAMHDGGWGSRHKIYGVLMKENMFFSDRCPLEFLASGRFVFHVHLVCSQFMVVFEVYGDIVCCRALTVKCCVGRAISQCTPVSDKMRKPELHL